MMNNPCLKEGLMNKYKCYICSGTGKVAESADGSEWYEVACTVCNGFGETKRFVRIPGCDKRNSRGDDFAGDAWFSQETGRIVYAAVGHDMNAAIAAEGEKKC